MNINERIKYLAKQFDIKPPKRGDVKYVLLPAKDVITLNYIFSPFHKSFGKTPNERLKKIEAFLESEEYKNESQKRFHGGSMPYSYLKIIKKKIPHFFAKIPETTFIAYSINKDEVILHEMIHCLLVCNKIKFKKYGYNEGLVKYLEYKALKKLKYNIMKNLSEKVEKLEDNETKNVWKAFFFFVKKMEDKTPKERKQFLLKLKKIKNG